MPVVLAEITSVKLFIRRGADSMESMWVLNSFLMGVDRWLVHFAPRGLIFLIAAHKTRVKLPPTPQKWRRPEKLLSLILSLIDPPSEMPNKSRGHSSVVEMKCLFSIDYLAAAPVSIPIMFSRQSLLPWYWIWICGWHCGITCSAHNHSLNRTLITTDLNASKQFHFGKHRYFWFLETINSQWQFSQCLFPAAPVQLRLLRCQIFFIQIHIWRINSVPVLTVTE